MLIKTDTTLQQEAKELFTEQMTIFQYYDSYRKQYDEIALDCYKKFVGYKEESEADRLARERGEVTRSNLHIPRTYQIIDTIRSRIVMTFFGHYPYVEFSPQPTHLDRFSLQLAEDKAKIASALVNEQLKKNNIATRFYDFVTSLLTFPAGYLGVGWRYEQAYVKKKVPAPEIIQTTFGPYYTGKTVYQVVENLESIWDDNEIVNIDYFDFWPDPKATDLDDCRGVFQREFVTFDELMQMLEFYRYLNEGNIYIQDPEELWEIQGTSLERGRDWRLSETGISSGVDVFINATDMRLKRNTEFELLHYWENDRHTITVNRQKVIYDGPSPYWRHRKLPFIAATYERLPNQFFGMSAVQIISDLQEEENTIHNQRTDNVNFILNKMWKVRRGADIDESELVSRPFGVIHVDHPDDVSEVHVADVAASSFHQQNIISTIMENTLATPPVIQGAESGSRKTATETLKMTGNAGMRFDVKIVLFRELGLNRLCMLMDMNNQQFIDDRRLVRLNLVDTVKWRSIDPGDLIGEYDYRPASPLLDPAVNKEVRREQLSHMLQVLIQMSVPFVDYHKLLEEWLRSFDIDNTEKFIIPREQWTQMQMYEQMLAQQAANQNQPSEVEQSENAMIGRAQGRRPQQERPISERASGVVR